MEAIPRKAVVAAACVLFALAILGAYQGWRRSTVEEAQTAADGGLSPAAAAVAGARPASALVETAPTPLNEAQIREIARQEVRATLRGDNAAASEAPATSGASATATTPGAPRATPIVPGSAPPQTPVERPAATPAPAESGGAPLF